MCFSKTSYTLKKLRHNFFRWRALLVKRRYSTICRDFVARRVIQDSYMFIKRLDLFGFKTFAEKTSVEMSQGITAVVGPNGSGKSNISDALLWVLGESNVRNIRGQRATDVIFNGSQKRKALGMAEVSLTLDNSCGSLPLNFMEVTVTRRAYRSGEAEYFINKSRCRLKDIYELFLDTGIGREAYSFVTQGEIDAILSAKPEDRRELFEEAAGIKKYRYRRNEALRKLEKTEANLHRITDIMSEISSQLDPLAEQAEQAKKFNELEIRLREIEIGLLIRDLRRFSESLTEAREAKKNGATKIEEYDKLLGDLEWEKDKQATKLGELEEQVDNARRVQQSLSANVQRLEGRAALLSEKLNSAKTSRKQADEEISALERKIQETRERIEKLEHDQIEYAQTEARVKSEVEARSKILEELDKTCDETARAINDQKANYLELAKEIAAKRNALQNSRERIVGLDGSLKKLAKEIDNFQEQKLDAEMRVAEASEQIESLMARIQESAAQIAKLNDERKLTEEEVSRLNKKYSDLSREIASKSSRLSTLREMAESHEGFFEGVRTVMLAKKANKLQGNFAVVADAITVPKGYETAIEIALGANVQDIITDSVDEAKRAITFLKDNRAGRATFLPLDGIRPSNHRVEGKMDSREGALGIAADLIEYNDKYDPAIWSLLGRTVVAQTIDDAIYLSKQLDGWNKIVTLDGELIVPSGAITGGTKKNKGPELLQRKQEIDSLTGDIKQLEQSSSDTQKRLRDAETCVSNSKADIQKLEKSLSDDRIALAEHQRRAEFASKEAERLIKQLEMVSQEQDEAEVLRADEAKSVERLETELRTVGQENSDLDLKVAGAEQNIEHLQKQRNAERQELMRLNVELASCTERTSALHRSLDDSKKSLDELTAGLAARHSQVDTISVDVTAILAERDSIERECATQRELFIAADKNLSQLTAVRTAEHEKTAQLDIQLKETGTKRNHLAQNTHDADVKEARLEVQVNQTTERLLEEYEVSYEQALDWPDEVEVERGTASEVARIRREIKEMGPVNIGAIGEYERIRERWDFLTEQRTDLESARDQINSAIKEIDMNTHGLFMETFNKVAENFDLIFKRLFRGGKTELKLTDPNDLLETGVDIIVQPPGKKLQDMSLMSGGERALTATALIFALLMVRPSPFVVMDEVDAPLDESNVERFAEVLQEFSKNSQFIVVTHNRATMEAANNLYGVTMQEPGISKILSVKLAAEGSVEEEFKSPIETLAPV